MENKRPVKVQYLFSQSDLIGSKAIVWGTKHQYPDLKPSEIPSHVAILINNKWVFQSTLEDGVHVMGYKAWKEINREVKKLNCAETRYYEDIKAMFKELKGQKYDWGGVVYMGLHLAKQKLFRTELPSENKWHDKDKYFCCEVMAKMTGLDYQMTSPVQVMVDLEAALDAIYKPSKLMQ